jgi:hypothetical protein
MGDHADVGNWACSLGIAALSVEAVIMLLPARRVWLARLRTRGVAPKAIPSSIATTSRACPGSAVPADRFATLPAGGGTASASLAVARSQGHGQAVSRARLAVDTAFSRPFCQAKRREDRRRLGRL